MKLPELLFIVKNYPYTQKLSNIVSLHEKKKVENLKIEFILQKYEIEIIGLKAGEFTADIEVKTKDNENKEWRIKVVVSNNYYS